MSGKSQRGVERDAGDGRAGVDRRGQRRAQDQGVGPGESRQHGTVLPFRRLDEAAAVAPDIAGAQMIGPPIVGRQRAGQPALFGVVVLAALLALGVRESVTALIMFTLGAFVLGTVVQEFWRGVRARRAVAREGVPVALVQLVKRNRRRYGGYLVHIGVAVLFVGVAASSSFQHEVDERLRREVRLHV